LGLERLRENLEAMGVTTKAARASYLQQHGIHEVRPFPHILIQYSSSTHQDLITCSAGTDQAHL
jgi:hypothetical protein